MTNIDGVLVDGVTLSDLTFVDKNGNSIELPQGIGLNDLTLVKDDGAMNMSLPNGVGLSGLKFIDSDANEYYVLNDLAIDGLNLADRFTDGINRYVGDDYELADLNTVLMDEVEKDKFRAKLIYSDESHEDYSFDGNNVYATGDAGVEIDGFLFFPEEVKGDESYARREYTRTKIMSGGEFVTRGQYTPKEYSFTTTLDIDPNEPYAYDKLFQIMENKPCEIVSPYMGDIFKAEVEITKTHPKASPGSLKLDIKVTEIVDPKTTVVGDTPIKYPSTNQLDDDAIDVKEVKKYNPKEQDKEESENAKIKADSKKYYGNGREVTEDSNPLSNKNVNEYRESLGN